MKKLLSIVLALAFVFALVPAAALAKTEAPQAQQAAEPETAPEQQSTTRNVYPGNVVIDEDATGGYEGDYVVIYNPATSSSTSYSTGTMTGLIETTIEPSIVDMPAETTRGGVPANSWRVDVDAMLNEMAKKENPDYGKDVPGNENTVKASYSVGDTKTFKIMAQYSPTGSSSVTFKCLYVGQHCYIWTPSSSSNNTYPLDNIDSSYAALAAAEFDSKFDLMQSSFGNHTNGTSGDGKLHMLYYNIDEGWNGSGGYVAGFFYQVDITNNGLPILNIDTYPGVTYNGSSSMEYTYNTMVHEYQHLINYSNTSGMGTWMNECWSAAAEEICYPGSSVVSRIQSYENYFYSSNWQDPPKEIEYNPTACPNLHKGYSMYGWSNDLDDVLALYGQVSLFAQYLFSRYGNTIYKTISSKYSSSETSAITSGTGMNCADLVKNFRVALVANTTENVLNGTYYFKTQSGYDPSQYYNVENPYTLLAPIVFTGTSCSIKGGGAICVKPVNGVYNPPSGASSSLKYIGVKFVRDAITSVSLEDVTVKCGGINNAKLTVLPEGTADYTVTYTSSAPGIFTVDANGVITGVAPGSGTLSAVVHDNTANTNFNASCTVTVENFHGYVLTDSVEVGEKYLIVAAGSISGTTGYAAGNTTVSGYSYYLNPVQVTIVDGSAVAYDSSIDFDAITWIPSGNASSGYAWKNVGNSKYIGLDSNEIVYPSSTATNWLYDSDKNFNCNTGDYPYLSFAEAASSRPMRYTSSSAGSVIHLFKYVEPVITYTVSAVSNNTSYGTVSVSGTVITCTPAAGYYVESCTVTAGTATYSINGNTIVVSPSSDCTIRVNFAPKPQYTVNYIVSGASAGSATAYVNDAVTLPTTVSVNPDGWTFIGWVAQHIDETTDEPTYYAPGASYTVTGNATLYALYNRLDGEGGETVYQKVDTLEVGGRYVITAGNYAVGNTIYNTSNNHYVTSKSVSINDSTNTLTPGSGVDINTILYEIESGSETAGYVFKNVANGKYLTLGSDEYLIVGDTALAWLWEGADLNNQVDSEGYYYLSRSSNSSYFTTSKQTNGTIVMYAETTLGTYYYTTSPVEVTPNEYTVTFKDWDGTVLKTETVVEGNAATAPANPTRTGYTFTGWDVDFSNVTSDLIVTAQYTINTYTVTFKDWDGTTLGTDEVEYGGTAVAPVTPTREGYTFTGWSSSLENITANKTVTAMYNINTYTVTFKDWDGTVLKTQTVNYGGNATAPANPTREGYTFTGWDVAFTNIKADTVVTAQYTINTYTVTFVDWNGTVLKTETVEYGAAATAPANPTREGYTFTGWDVAFNNVTSNLTVTAQYVENGLEPTLMGDINCDGKVDTTDALLALRYTMGTATDVTAQGLVNADMDGDGEITSTDAILIMRQVMGTKLLG